MDVRGWPLRSDRPDRGILLGALIAAVGATACEPLTEAELAAALTPESAAAQGSGGEAGEGSGDSPEQCPERRPLAQIDVTAPADAFEDVPFEVRVRAVDTAGCAPNLWDRRLTISVDRGDVKPLRQTRLDDGGVSVVVAVNRAGVLKVSLQEAGGTARGTSATISVRPTPWARVQDGVALLSEGEAGTWDDRDVGQPCVIQVGERPGAAISDRLVMYYRGRSEADGEATGVGVALSADGLVWTRARADAALPPERTANGRLLAFSEPTVLERDGAYRMWAVGAADADVTIHHAQGVDGLAWARRAPNPVLDATVGGRWTETFVFAPTVTLTDGIYEMWYGGLTAQETTGIGYAASNEGVRWAKSDANPVLEALAGAWDQGGVDKPAVVRHGSVYRMWYTGDSGPDPGAPTIPSRWSIGYATSTDALTWERHGVTPVLAPTGAAGDFDQLRVGNPSVVLLTSPLSPEGTDNLLEPWLFYDGYDGRRWRIGAARPDYDASPRSPR